MNRTAKRIFGSIAALLVLLCVIGIVCAVRFAWPFIYTRDVDAEIAKLKAQGKPVCAEDLVRSRIPDSQNAAVLYAKAFKSMRLTPQEAKVVSGFLGENARRDDKAWATIRSLVAQNEAALAFAAQAASRPKCSFPVEWQKGYDAEMPHLDKLRQLANLTAARAMESAEDGRMEPALGDVETALALSQAVRDEPKLISALAQFSLVRTAGDALRNCLPNGHIEEAQARRLYDSLGGIDLNTSLITALEGERAMGLMVIRQLQTGKVPLKDAPQGDDRAGANPVFAGIMRADRRIYVDRMAEVIRRARLPWAEVKRRGLDNDLDEGIPKYAHATAIFLPVTAKITASRDSAIAVIREARIALALEAYWDRFRTYPETLDQLSWKIEKDPFSGKSFVYKRLPRGYLLYSVSANLKDDGGKSADYFQAKERAARSKAVRKGIVGEGQTKSWTEVGDIVWRVER